jgi:NAD(P)-dependent dehydrogenase (short-subunit alcohol dehydrogenase family)
MTLALSRVRRVSAAWLALLVLLVVVANVLPAQTSIGAGRAVLVTGASSGIGRTITEHLAARGFFVYGTARKPEDIAALSRIPNVQGLRLDVTVQAEIDSAVATVRRGGRRLYAVVNNAGVAAIAPLIEMADRDLTNMIDVNVLGPFRVTKAFSPLIIETKGRVVMISSISGVLSGGLFGGYSMSKHAVEAYGDALATEMARFNVGVSLVEPGNFRSDIGRNTTGQIERAIAANPNSPYITQMQNMIPAMKAYEERYPLPTAVAEAVTHAITDSAPRRRYMVVPVAREGEVTIRKAVEELVQLNQWNAFKLDRDALVRMLDSVLARHP